MGGARQAGDAELEIRLLGPFDVLAGGRALTIGGPKPRALLAVLALQVGRVVSVDRLVETLWPGDQPETAAHAIQVYVSQLRRALGKETISTRAPGYVLEVDSERVDVHRFARLADEGRAARQAGAAVAAERALREALSLWKGAALADFTYEPFAQAEIARLEELRVVALEERLDADLALGRHAELVSELEALVDTQPLRERPRAQLMLALYRSGRQADALAAYRAARETLVDELGIEPGPALRELEASILRQDPSLLLDETARSGAAMQFRRLVTILFVDVVDSLALAGAVDPEALGEILRRYFDTVSAAVGRHGGAVEKFAGDSVLAAFGIPVSHEDDALRAARAAVEIRSGLETLDEQLGREQGVSLEIRIGIESGEVVWTETDARQRLVTGEAVGVASRLEQAAAAGEIVVGELAGRLIDHVAVLEPLGGVALEGKREPVHAYRLLELTPIAPAFEGRLDAPLVGRKTELAILRKTLARVVESASPHVVVVVGPAGVGKSRLAAEHERKAKDATVLWGRCLSYGDGITYWPLREIVEQAPAADERTAVLAALDAEPPPSGSEVGLLFRQFCDALAGKRPLVLVFDDVHWAEPTLLELLEQVGDRARGPIQVVCLARDELLEERPEFLTDRTNADRIVLEPLTVDETQALVDGLGGATLESDQRARIVEGAEGNPLFVEQLLALAYEGGLAADALPATVQALLAARLDRLGPGERAVLERAAVIGKQFRYDDVVALLEPDAVRTADAHLRTLVAGGFVRPVEGGELHFRHVLVQQAVYRAAPKRLRAELHERFTRRFEAREEIADVDDFAGYHLEQAHRLRSELGEADARTRELGVEAGQRLGVAGIRAFKRGDLHATMTLLERATALLPGDDPLRRELRCNLGISWWVSGRSDDAVALLEGVIADSEQAGDARIAAWARVELMYVQVRRGDGATADDLLDAVFAGIPIFERADDHRALGRAWLFSGWVQGGHRGDHAAWAEAAERALEHYGAIAWPASTCLGELGAALYWGATPAGDAVARCEELLHDARADRSGIAYLQTFLGGLSAMRGDFDRARELVEGAQATLDELGLHGVVLAYCLTVLGEIELLAGEPATAERILRQLCGELQERHDLSHLASRASDLAEALLVQDSVDEADEWTRIAEANAAADDVNAQMMWRPVRARILARRGDLARAEKLAVESVRLSEATDDLNRRAKLLRDLGEVLRASGRSSDAAAAYAQAAELFERKGNVVALARIRSLEDDLALV